MTLLIAQMVSNFPGDTPSMCEFPQHILSIMGIKSRFSAIFANNLFSLPYGFVLRQVYTIAPLVPFDCHVGVITPISI